MRHVNISAAVHSDGINRFIVIRRGHWGSFKVRLDEAHTLADRLVDLVEQETKHE